MVHFQFVRGLKGVIATDRDEGVDFEGAEPFVDAAQGGDEFGVFEVIGAVDVFPGVGPGGADHDPAAGAGVGQEIVGQSDVIGPFTKRAGGAVFGEAAVTVFDPEDLGPFFEEGVGRGADDGVGPRCWPAGKQDGDSFDVEVVMAAHDRSRETLGFVSGRGVVWW